MPLLKNEINLSDGCDITPVIEKLFQIRIDCTKQIELRSNEDFLTLGSD